MGISRLFINFAFLIFGVKSIFNGINKKYTNDEINEYEGCKIKNIDKYIVVDKIRYYIFGVLCIILAIFDFYKEHINSKLHTVLTVIILFILVADTILRKIYISKKCR